jgi:hypothetical protein
MCEVNSLSRVESPFYCHVNIVLLVAIVGVKNCFEFLLPMVFHICMTFRFC